MKGNKHSAGRTAWNKGIKCPNISEALKGKTRSQEVKDIISRNTKEAWDAGKFKDRDNTWSDERRSRPHPMLGKNQSDKQKEAVRLANTGKIVSKVTRDKLSEAAKGRPPVTCPHCGHTGKGPNIYRFHMKNCFHA